MPSGYTHGVVEGTTVKLTEFIRKTACSHFYDTTAIPDRLEHNNYYDEALKEAQENVAELRAMSLAECQEFGEREKASQTRIYKDFVASKLTTRQRIVRMLSAVEQWQSPSKEHDPLKRFMIDQLRDSLKYDCDHSYSLERLTEIEAQESFTFYAAALNQAQHNVEYYSEEAAKVLKRETEQNQWLALLHTNLRLLEAQGL